MGLLIRAITLVIFLSGCSSFVIKNIEPKYGKFFERKIDTTKLTIDAKLISFNSRNFIYGYSYNLDHSSNKKIIQTDEIIFEEICSKLIKTFGLYNDFEILEYDCDIFKNFGNAGLKIPYSQSNVLIKFSNPKTTFLNMDLSYKVVDRDSSSFVAGKKFENLTLIEESFRVKKIGWKGKNYYWLNREDEIIKTIQFNEPGFYYIKVQSI